jgi:hypothetical protein
MTQVWLDAGFQTEQVDVESRKLVFRRVSPRSPESAGGPSSAASDTQPNGTPRHPLIGWMKGTFTIAPGVDLAKPAMPEWGEVAYGDKTWDDFK